MERVGAWLQTAEVGMVHAGHRAPGLVESFQIILVHGILDVRIVEVREEDAQ